MPPATVRRGAFIAPNVVLMPSYVNIGAYVDSGTMVDTWATVGSCAQIGKNVHLSGGVGIGGVLEPLQASPTIIEDNCFIGARSEIVEGVIVESGAVISMGVFIGQSTRIYDRERDEISYGRVPAGAVVVPGSLPASNGKYSLACAVIVKRVDAQTRAKTSINELLAQRLSGAVALAMRSRPSCRRARSGAHSDRRNMARRMRWRGLAMEGHPGLARTGTTAECFPRSLQGRIHGGPGNACPIRPSHRTSSHLKRRRSVQPNRPVM